jgi:TolA-binding protein
VTDRVDRALRALRELETGKNPDSEETLHRVLAQRQADGRAFRRRVRLWLPIAAVLTVSTAAVARWGSIQATFGSLRARGNVELTHSAAPHAAQPAGSSQLVAPPPAPPPAPSPSQEELLAPLAPVPLEPPPRAIPPPPIAPTPAPAMHGIAVSRPSPSVPPATSPVASSPSASAAASETLSARPPASGVPSDSDVYAHAHRLHFAGSDPASALSALDDYLMRFPDGRFAPDARYNRAIDLLKLRRYAEARAALQPFAVGAFGGYHRDDAGELLRTIP